MGTNERGHEDRIRRSSTSHVIRDRNWYSVEHQKMGFVTWDYDKIIPWTVALNKLDFAASRFRANTFKYFSLTNPPSTEEQAARTARLGGHTYDEVQDTLTDAAAKFELEWYNKRQRYNEFEIDYIKGILEGEKEAAKQTETQIFNIIAKKLNLPVDYETLLSNTDTAFSNLSNTHPLQSNSINDIKLMDTITFWTKVGLNQISAGGGINKEWLVKNGAVDPVMAFSIVSSSKEFYDQLKAVGLASIFSRHGAEKWYRQKYPDDTTPWDLNNSRINQQALLALQEALDEYAKQYEEDVAKELREIFSNALGTYLGSDGKLKEKRQATSASQASSLLRTKIKEGIKDKGLSSIVKEIKLTADGRDETAFFVVYTDDSYQNELYKATMRVQAEYLKECAKTGNQMDFNTFLASDEGYKFRERLIVETFLAFEGAIGNLSSTSVLSLQKLGKFDITQYTTTTAFYHAAQEFCSKYESAPAGLVNKYNDLATDLWKSFRAANNNAYVSGLLGELSTVLRTNNIFDRMGQMTGSVFSNGSTYGESVNDLTYAASGKKEDRVQKMGVNIKNYITSDGNTLTLYPSANGIGVENDTIKKYLNWQETEIIRFVAANSALFSQQFLEDYTYLAANKRIKNFYRFTDRARGSATNVFFQLNNVIYPLSYIYDNALKQLSDIEEKNHRSILFDVEIKKFQDQLFQYDNIQEAEEKWTDVDFRLSQRKITPMDTTVRIRTKGLRINLMSLSLF